MENLCQFGCENTSGESPCCRCTPQANPEQIAWLRQICTYLHQHYGQPDLSLTCLSHQVYTSSAYLSTLFYKLTGRHYKSCLIDLRMGKASQLLLETDLCVYQIAEQIGYNNSQYFSVIFKKHTGCSPTEYRARHT